jgi:phosphoglycerate dehydrogenase-like enzyme
MHLLTNVEFVRDFGERLRTVCSRLGLALEPVTLPADPAQRLDRATLEAIEVACFTGNFEDDMVFTRRFLGSALHAPNLRWMHLPNAGVDHPVFGRLRAQGVRLTTSSGAAAEAIAQTAIAALLALARGFPHWWRAQQQRQWAPHPPAQPPADLRGQRLVIIGLGAIGTRIAQLGRALGLYVIGVRRQPRRADDPVDELHPPLALHQLLPHADWLVLACPLTDETRHLVNAAALARLSPAAHLLNVARGDIVDEAALIDALRAGRLAGAYLDVFAEEPLPASSPLWELPNVIVTPHDAGAASGNAARVAELFLANFERWARGEPLINEVQSSEQP